MPTRPNSYKLRGLTGGRPPVGKEFCSVGGPDLQFTVWAGTLRKWTRCPLFLFWARELQTSRDGNVYRDIPEDLRRLIEPVVEDHDCELVDVETVSGSSRRGVLKITIDRKQGDGRVAVESCAEISREIATQLDVHDAVVGSYNLEVSSPGLDRMLSREKDFAAVCGQEVKLKTRRPVAGRRKFKGRLLDFSDGIAVLSVDGNHFEVPFAEIERANSM
ncbi:MAG TPA: ribosome maturation factor RimP, partial [Candidatus Latescibacteria bacterium]|nr:ribosome maturation factor RimP [Candidatus Latescibacterota bacterium]